MLYKETFLGGSNKKFESFPSEERKNSDGFSSDSPTGDFTSALLLDCDGIYGVETEAKCQQTINWTVRASRQHIRQPGKIKWNKLNKIQNKHQSVQYVTILSLHMRIHHNGGQPAWQSPVHSKRTIFDWRSQAGILGQFEDQ